MQPAMQHALAAADKQSQERPAVPGLARMGTRVLAAWLCASSVAVAVASARLTPDEELFLLSVPNSSGAAAALHYYATRVPHVAGTPGDLRTA